MKKHILYTIAIATLGTLAFSSCELDEYNPSAGEATLESPSTWKGMQAYCYSTLYHELYSKSDFLFLSECGTDLWLNPANTEYASEVFYYDGLGVERQEPRKAWQQAYSVIATCNTVIKSASKVEGASEGELSVLTAEAKVIRAFMHLTLATYYGPITIASSEVGQIDKTPVRSSLADVYNSITTDLKEAAASLGETPYEGNYARVTKKTALGLLARAYAQGAGEGLSEDGKSYWQRAKEVVEDLIPNPESYSGKYGIKLHQDVADLWAQNNNRNNAEALFTAAGLDATSADANQAATDVLNATSYLYAYTRANPNECKDLFKTQKASNIYHGSHTQSGVMAPTKYAIDVFGDWDKRYENTFLTAFGEYTLDGDIVGPNSYTKKSVKLTAANCMTFGMNSTQNGKSIYPYVHLKQAERPGGLQTYAVGIYEKGGDKNNIVPTKNPFVIEQPLQTDEDRISIWLSKKYMTNDDRQNYRMFIMNIDDLFDADGNYETASYCIVMPRNTYGRSLFPSLIKYNFLFDGATRHLGTDQYDFRNGDIMVMRTAELYLIGAEANVALGNSAEAAKYIQPLWNRASRTGAAPTVSGVDEQFILDEYAREFAGEHMRWPVLKRHHAFEAQLSKYNKKAYKWFRPEIHYCRPIPKEFLDQITNAGEYGDNGYGYVGNKGY